MSELEQASIIRIKELMAQGYQVGVAWDCGGDQSPCWLTINEKPLHECEEDTSALMTRSFTQDIIYGLGLPNAGECYSKGAGTFFFNEADKLALNYRCFDYCEAYDDPLQLPNQRYPIAIHKVAQKYLHKARISLNGYVYLYRFGEEEYKTQLSYVSAQMNTLHGDPIHFKQQQEAFYIEQAKQLLHQFANDNRHLLNTPNSIIEFHLTASLIKPDLVETRCEADRNTGKVKEQVYILFS